MLRYIPADVFVASRQKVRMVITIAVARIDTMSSSVLSPVILS